MEVVLAGLHWVTCLCYLDDVLVFSPSFEEHLDDLAGVFDRFILHNLRAKPSKCFFGREQIDFLGHVVGAKGLSPNPKKVEAVSNFPQPTDVTSLQRFLGLINYYRRFIESFASTAIPLYALLRHDAEWEWTEKCQRAFEALKASLAAAPTLAFPDWRREFILTTDASQFSLGAILSQPNDEGVECPVSFASRTLKREELKWANATEWEALAILWGIMQNRAFLEGRHFTILTDHAPLKWLMNHKDANPRLMKWVLKLQGYDFTIVHKPGKDNVNADALSRAPHCSFVTTASTSASRAADARAAFPREFELPADAEPGDLQWAGGYWSDVNASTFVRASTFDGENWSDWTPDRIMNRVINARPDVIDPELDEFLDRPPDQRVRAVKTRAPADDVVTDILTSAANWEQDTVRPRLGLEQRADPELLAIFEAIERPRPGRAHGTSAPVPKFARRYRVVDDQLVRLGRVGERMHHQIVVPTVWRKTLLKAYHNDRLGAHMGREKTWQKLSRKYFWPRMYRDVEDYVAACDQCALTKAAGATRGTVPIQPIPVPGRPFYRIACDCLEFTQSEQGNKYAVVFMDYLTKWVEVFAVPDIQVRTISKLLVQQIIPRHGVPREFLTDRGSNYTSYEFRGMCSALGIKNIYTTPGHPQTDGMVERFNRTLCEMLALYVKETQRDWDEILDTVVGAYRMSVHSSTNDSPFFLLYGRDPVQPVDFLFTGPEYSHACQEDHRDFLMRITRTAWYNAIKEIEKSQMYYKRYADRNARPTPFRLGDVVALKVKQVGRGKKLKLAKKWAGPFRIVELTESNAVISSILNTQAEPKKVHLCNLKFYRAALAYESMSVLDAPDVPDEAEVPQFLKDQVNVLTNLPMVPDAVLEHGEDMRTMHDALAAAQTEQDRLDRERLDNYTSAYAEMMKRYDHYDEYDDPPRDTVELPPTAAPGIKKANLPDPTVRRRYGPRPIVMPPREDAVPKRVLQPSPPDARRRSERLASKREQKMLQRLSAGAVQAFRDKALSRALGSEDVIKPLDELRALPPGTILCTLGMVTAPTDDGDAAAPTDDDASAASDELNSPEVADAAAQTE